MMIFTKTLTLIGGYKETIMKKYPAQTKHDQHHTEIVVLELTETQVSKLKLQHGKLCSATSLLKSNKIGRQEIHVMEFAIKELEEVFETLNLKYK